MLRIQQPTERVTGSAGSETGHFKGFNMLYRPLVIQKGRSVGMKVSFHIEEGVLPFWLSPYGDIFLIHLKMSSAYFI